MNKRIPIFLGLILVAIAVWLLVTPNKFVNNFIERLDTLGYDLQLRTRINTYKQMPLSPIAIIDVDEKSLKAEGRWPWQRGKLGKLVDELHELGAAVIAFDIIFPEKERNIAEVVSQEFSKRNLLEQKALEVLNQNKDFFDEDNNFVKSIESVQPILSLGFLSSRHTTNLLPAPLLTLTDEEYMQLDITHAEGYISNISVLQQAAKYAGFINIFPDLDGIVRRAPLIIEYKKGIYPSLALQAVMRFLDEKISLFTPRYDKERKLEGIQLGTHLIPTDAYGKALIPFIGKSYTFPFYSATDVLQKHIPQNALTGKIVFIGTSALGLGDLQPTAIQSPYPGVEIHATLANGILQDLFSSVPEWTRGAELFLALLFGLISAFIFPYLGPRMLGLIIVLFPFSLHFANNLIWEKTGLVLSLLMPSLLVLLIGLVNIIYGYLFETRKREHLKEMFGQYVPAKHIDEMLKSSGNYALRGESRELSVLFADIRNFTMISENMQANELVELLNTLFTPMTEIIFKHRGTIDKYVGDLIMAFWGAPLKDKNHAQHAIASALDMQKKVKDMQKMLEQRNWAEIHLGIGINSGVMNVGDMGSRYRRNYTVLGDAVNLASRVEGLTKFYGVSIIVTENTQANQTKFIFRKLDKVRVKGKKNGIAIYEVVCLQTEAAPELLQELETYHKALDLYFLQQWDEARKWMVQLHDQFPQIKLYQIYIERIDEFKHQSLPEDWDGIYAHATK